jgi:multiple sugar transport system permease protein
MKKFYSKPLIATTIIFIWICISLLPIYFMFITSIKTDEEVYLPYVTWIPVKPTLSAYYYALFETKPFAKYILNTIFIATITTVSCIVLASSAAYALSRFSFKGKNTSYLAILGSRLLPPLSMIIPWFIVASYIGLIDSLWILIITNIYMNLPFDIWLLKGFFDGIPHELDDAALVDGCTHFQTFRKIILPLTAPGVGAVGVLTFLFTWNEFIFSVTLSQTPASRVVSSGVYDFISDAFIAWPQLNAAAMLATIPAMIFVVFFQSYLVRGLVAGALKR